MKTSKKFKGRRLTKEESDKILKNMKKGGCKPKTKRIKAIKFHKDFDKGMRLGLCLKCGYPIMFLGASWYCGQCDYDKKFKAYPLEKLDDFISKLQEMHYEKEEKTEKLKRRIRALR